MKAPQISWIGLSLLLLLHWAVQAEPILRWEKLPDFPNKVGLASPFAGVSGNALIVAGGANFPDRMPWEGGRKVWYKDVYILPEPNGTWKGGFTLQRPVAYGVSITTDKGLVCIGGGDTDKHFTDVFLLEWINDNLTTRDLPSLPRPNAFGAGALLGKKIYIAGGIETPNATNTQKLFCSLDLSKPNAKWEELPPWPGPGRMLAVAAAVDGSLYLAGGTDLFAGLDGKPQRTYLRDAYCYTPGKGWAAIAAMPRPAVAAPSPAPIMGRSRFLIIGGDDGSKVGFQTADKHPGFSREILAYDTIADRWDPIAEAPFAHVTVPALRWGNRIVIPSGEVRPGVRSPVVWCGTGVTGKLSRGVLAPASSPRERQ